METIKAGSAKQDILLFTNENKLKALTETGLTIEVLNKFPLSISVGLLANL